MCGVLRLLTQYPSLLWLLRTDGERRKRDTLRAKRQFDMEEFEATAEERRTGDDTSRSTVEKKEEEEEAPGSAAGSAYNPENPYHVSTVHSDVFMINMGIIAASF